MDRQTDKKQTNEQTELHQFERNLSMMLIYLPVKFEFDWTNRFRVRVQNGNFDGQMDGRNYTNFKRNLAMMVIYLPVKFEFDRTKRFQVRVRKRKCGRTDRRTDKRRTHQSNRRVGYMQPT